MLLLCILSLFIIPVYAVQNTADFQNSLERLLNGALRVADMQRVLDNDVTFTETAVDGANILNNLQQALSTKINAQFSLVKNLQNVVQQSFNTFSSHRFTTECCYVYLNNEIDYGFKHKVDRTNMCVRESEYVENGAKYASQVLLQQFKDNIAAVPGIKYQYFGSEHGLMFSYPATHAEDCDSYDPRFRPWYVETATPVAKDVVIVIDVSGSMIYKQGGKRKIDIAKSAAKAVIDTLNPKDRIGVIDFSNDARGYQGDDSENCYGTRLAVANPHNKRKLSAYVDSLVTRSTTHYNRGLQAAFKLFLNASYSGHFSNERRKAILFLSDGAPSDPLSGIVNIINDNEALLGNNVTIMPFGIGSVSTSVLDTMASTSQKYESSTVMITDLSKLRKSMASYYKFFGDHGFTTPHISTPYFDAFGLGLITTLTLPVYVNGFVGVVGIDLTLSDLFQDIHHFVQDDKSYAFVINPDGMALAHPMLPIPETVLSDPVDIEIELLEKYTGSTDIIASMKSGSGVSARALTTIFQPKGDGKSEGMVETTYNADYYWRQVLDTSTSEPILAVAVKVVENVTSTNNANLNTPMSQVPFTYHDIKLMSNPPSTCAHFLTEAVVDQSVVKLSAQSFLEPYVYLNDKETSGTVVIYNSIIQGSRTNDLFKPGVVESVQISSKINALWFEANLQDSFAVWRYIATNNGVLRVTPGTNLNKLYDPTQRDWFKRSVAFPGFTVVSAPYLDAFGAGFVITLSHVLYEGRPNALTHLPAEPVVGVMAVDVTVNYLYQLLLADFPDCQLNHYSCFVVDSAGYLVVHPEFIEVTGQETPLVGNIHITIKEKHIANYMISQMVMKKKSCNDLHTLKEHFYYEIDPNTFSAMSNLHGSPGFEMRLISQTNTFFVMASSDASSIYCPCRNERLHTSECYNIAAPCECPCARNKSSSYDSCANQYTYTNLQDFDACTPSSPTLKLQFPERHVLDSLPPCFEVDCHSHSSNACSLYPQCNWCITDERGNDLAAPYCGQASECYFGQVGFDSPYGDLFGDVKDSVNSFFAFLKRNLQIILPILLISVAVISCYLCRKKSNTKRPSSSNAYPQHQQGLNQPQPPPGVVLGQMSPSVVPSHAAYGPPPPTSGNYPAPPPPPYPQSPQLHGYGYPHHQPQGPYQQPQGSYQQPQGSYQQPQGSYGYAQSPAAPPSVAYPPPPPPPPQIAYM